MLADKRSEPSYSVYHVCAFLPAVGLVGSFPPSAQGKAVVAAMGA